LAGENAEIVLWTVAIFTTRKWRIIFTEHCRASCILRKLAEATE
jgi:hypothetical protein